MYPPCATNRDGLIGPSTKIKSQAEPLVYPARSAARLCKTHPVACILALSILSLRSLTLDTEREAGRETGSKTVPLCVLVSGC